MDINFEVGSPMLIVNNVTLGDFAHVVEVLLEHTQQVQLAPPQRFDVDLEPTGTPLGRVYDGQLDDLTEAQLDDLTRANGDVVNATVHQHLQPPELDDDDALARIAYNTYDSQPSGGIEAWRAVAAAVRTAAQLQEANRVAADA